MLGCLVKNAMVVMDLKVIHNTNTSLMSGIYYVRISGEG